MINRYQLLLFDADDTLFDFHKSEQSAFHRMLQACKIEASGDSLYPHYREISLGLWQQLERNEITKDKIKTHRFELLFQKHGIEACPVSAGDTYLQLLPQDVHLIEGAREACKDLSQEFKLGIITNGIQSVQEQRLRRSGLADYFSFMVVSEECGFHKPDPRIFEHALRKANFTADDALMIGDRFEADILGAKNSKIDSCWFNPKGNLRTNDHVPTYEILKLDELAGFLLP